MGMYNEVRKRCPDCGHTGIAQVHSIVSGFGEFNLDDLNDLAEKLTVEQMEELKEALVNKIFSCEFCEDGFYLKDALKERYSAAMRLFGEQE